MESFPIKVLGREVLDILDQVANFERLNWSPVEEFS